MSVTTYKPPREIDLTAPYGEWIGHPSCESPGKAEQDLIDHRAEILVYAEIADDEADYSYDDFALIRLKGTDLWYLLNTSGCSCPSPDETWNVQIGPTTLAEVRKFVTEGEYSGYTMPKRQMAEFVKALDEAAASC